MEETSTTYKIVVLHGKKVSEYEFYSYELFKKAYEHLIEMEKIVPTGRELYCYEIKTIERKMEKGEL